MATELTMPKLGFDMEVGTIVNWLKQPGEFVQSGSLLFEVETDKATIEVEVQSSGFLTQIIIEAGETVPVGTVVGVLNGEKEKDETYGGSLLKKSPGSDERMEVITHNNISSEENIRKPVLNTDFAIASPLARRIAKDKGIDLHAIEGTGPRGMVVKKDVLAYKKMPLENPIRVIREGEKDFTEQQLLTRKESAVRREPLSKLRSTIAQRMSKSVITVPHFSVSLGIDMTKALALRQSYNDKRPKEEQMSVNDLVVRAAALTLRTYPRLNSSFVDNFIQYNAEINIGIAVALEDGLITVVIPRVDRKALSQIAAESRAAIRRARENKMRPDDMQGSTFTISNLGMFGVDHFTAIINPPEAAILAVGAVKEIPWNVDGTIKLQPRMEITLSVDHRISDGAEAARFLQTFKDYLEEPMNMI